MPEKKEPTSEQSQAPQNIDANGVGSWFTRNRKLLIILSVVIAIAVISGLGFVYRDQISGIFTDENESATNSQEIDENSAETVDVPTLMTTAYDNLPEEEQNTFHVLYSRAQIAQTQGDESDYEQYLRQAGEKYQQSGAPNYELMNFAVALHEFDQQQAATVLDSIWPSDSGVEPSEAIAWADAARLVDENAKEQAYLQVGLDYLRSFDDSQLNPQILESISDFEDRLQ